VVFGDEMKQIMQQIKGKVKPTATAVVACLQGMDHGWTDKWMIHDTQYTDCWITT